MPKLDQMTQAQWDRLSIRQREVIQDDGSLTTQLLGLEGCRVEVVTNYGETRRFLVGRSTGWRPIHIELSNIRSSGGAGAHHSYHSVKVLYRQRPSRHPVQPAGDIPTH